MRYWVKLYTEIVNDPKMGRLTDRQFRTCINLFALAGEIDQDGTLPDVDDLAWRLRLQRADLIADLEALAAVNILTATSEGWIISKWEERQAKAPSAAKEKVLQRVHEYRERERNEDVTTLHPEVKRAVTPPEKNRIDIEKKRKEQSMQDDGETPPEVRAISNAYDACGLMMTKTHLDAHLLIIKQVGLANWQRGWAAAMDKGKQNVPTYVARCAESAMLAEQRGNGHNKGASVPQTLEDRKRMYATEGEDT
jgi:hypothetical protein